MKNWLWIAGIVLGVIMLASVLYYSMSGEQQTTPAEHVPTPTNALPNNAEHRTKIYTPTPTETPTPTPTTAVAETTMKAEFVIGDRDSQAITNDGILEVDFLQRGYTRLEDYKVTGREEYDGWDTVYEIPSVCTVIRFRFSATTLFEQRGSQKEETTDYYSYFNGNSLTRDDKLVMLSVPTERETDSLTLLLRNDEARVMQNGYVLASFIVKDRKVQCLLSFDGSEEPDYKRFVYISEEGRLESMYIEEVGGQTACYDRLTRHILWRLSEYNDSEHEYCLEARDPRSPEDRDDMIVLYRGEPDMMPSEVYGITNTSFSLLDRIDEAEADAEMPTREWDESVHTSILTTNSYCTLYMDTRYCGYLQADENDRETVQGTVIERHFRWENPDLHINLEIVVANSECAIDSRVVINDPEYPRYLLRTYHVSDRKSRSRAEDDNGLLWVEEAMLADDEPYRLVRTYTDTDRIRIRDLSHGQIYSEEITDYAGKRISITQFTYAEGKVQRMEKRDSADNLVETCDYIYDAQNELVKSVRKTYDADGNLSGSVSYDADGNEIPEDTEN